MSFVHTVLLWPVLTSLSVLVKPGIIYSKLMMLYLKFCIAKEKLVTGENKYQMIELFVKN